MLVVCFSVLFYNPPPSVVVCVLSSRRPQLAIPFLRCFEFKCLFVLREGRDRLLLICRIRFPPPQTYRPSPCNYCALGLSPQR